MNHGLRCLRCVWILLALSAACASSREPRNSAPETEGQREYVLSEDVSVRRLAPGVWIHTTLAGEDFGRYPANGLVVEDGDGSFLVDAGWNPQQAERLVEWAQKELRHPVRAAVVTHFHSDRLGGMQALQSGACPSTAWRRPRGSRQQKPRGLPSLAHLRGAAARGANRAVLSRGRPLTGQHRGLAPGQRRPVWRLLREGWLAKNLGNVADADLAAWPASLERTRGQFPQMRIVVPGHGLPGGPDLLTHTRELLSEQSAPR